MIPSANELSRQMVGRMDYRGRPILADRPRVQPSELGSTTFLVRAFFTFLLILEK